jgi:hypothetical protein
MILSSEEVGQELINKTENVLNSRTVRSYFAQCVYQEKFNIDKPQILTEKGFDELTFMIYHALLLSNNSMKQYDEIRLLTLSSFYYYKYIILKKDS